jgi:threonine synthase
MILYNTANPEQTTNFENAVFQGLAEGNGLFMPSNFPRFPESFFSKLPRLSFPEMAFEIVNALIGDEIPKEVVREICEDAFNFPIPLVKLGDQIQTLELFHGPSLAFKDFGARFMSRVMAYFNQKQQKKLHILVATSGDTGGAVAMGFHNVSGIQVSILFPKNRVSKYQEVQLTSLGGNIKAYEVDGSFDDCQAFVKKAFSDREFSKKEGLASANSINIARLIPQALYYFKAWADVQKQKPGAEVVFSVPSGNFGNICAAAFAWKMGLPIKKLIASVNANRVFTDYLSSGSLIPKPSVSTLSNAMDVGNPSNFVRIEALLGDVKGVKELFQSYSFSDSETKLAELDLFNTYSYLSEPHAAIGYLGLQHYFKENSSEAVGIFLGTAHPAKFIPVLPEAFKDQIEIPKAILDLLEKPSEKTEIGLDYEVFKEFISGS